jgi:hypothetical protein
VLELPGHENVNFNIGAEPFARLNTGVLYTSRLSRDDIDIVQTCGGEETNLHKIAADLAVAIDLQGHGRMIIEWGDVGKPGT